MEGEPQIQIEEKRTYVDEFNEGNITLQDYLVEFSKDLITRGAQPHEIDKALRNEQTRIFNGVES